MFLQENWNLVNVVLFQTFGINLINIIFGFL
jgi:hypothetical protein